MFEPVLTLYVQLFTLRQFNCLLLAKKRLRRKCRSHFSKLLQGGGAGFKNWSEKNVDGYKNITGVVRRQSKKDQLPSPEGVSCLHLKDSPLRC